MKCPKCGADTYTFEVYDEIEFTGGYGAGWICETCDYEGDEPPPGPKEDVEVDLKWSLWTTDESIWQDYAPGVLDKIKRGEVAVLRTAPRKEIRYGDVEFLDNGKVLVNFRTEWDEPYDLANTLCPAGDDEAEVERIAEYLKGRDCDPFDTDLGTRIVRELDKFDLEEIDKVENDLLEEDERNWKQLKADVEELLKPGIAPPIDPGTYGMFPED